MGNETAVKQALERAGAAGSCPLVHLELHTSDLDAARRFYAELFDWKARRLQTPHGSYVAVDLGRGEVGGGMVECGVERSLWLPYVEVERIGAVTERARELGAKVMLEPREGPAGWRSVVTSPSGAQVALWQGKDPR